MMRRARSSAFPFAEGGGGMGALMRAHEWSRTPLGRVEFWPESLRSALSICLGSGFPIAIYWGPELALLYNDAWSPIPGNKHPWALGRPAREVWPEIWDTIGPLFEQVMASGEATYAEDSLLPMRRHGYTEECYFNFTFSPIRGSGGDVEGVFNAVIETTYRVITERRTGLLRELADAMAPARSKEEACRLAAAALARGPLDVPFCALYLIDEATGQARCAAQAGLPPDSPAAPASLSTESEATVPWPLGAAGVAGRVQAVDDLDARFGVPLPGGPWNEPARSALVAPMASAATGRPIGYLVAGASPRRALDAAYQQFAEQAALHVANAISSAAAYETQRKRAVRFGALLQSAEIRRRALEQERRAAQALREKLEEMRTLLDALPISVFISHDATCTHITMNAAGAALLRISEHANASVTGPEGNALPFRVLKDGVEIPGEELPMQRAARLGRSVIGEEVDVAFPDGTSTRLYEHAVPLFDAAGAVRGCVGVFVDLTERMRAEEALKAADRRKDEFLATLSHELRNPLAPIRNAVSLLRDAGADGELRDKATGILERQVQHMIRLVDDLLDVARIARDALELRREPVEIASLVRSALETSEPHIQAARHRLTVSMPQAPLRVEGDPVRLAQILANLLNNAAKYTAPGGEIRVEAREENGFLGVSVRDNGPGIAPEVLPGLFEMFGRATPRAGRGLGIGLALSRRLAELHGGTLEARSAGLGKGAELILRLPLSGAADACANAEPVETTALGGRRVLVVDDNADAAESLGMLLRLLGADVRVAQDGRGALAAAESYRPHAVLLDIGMPDMDGYEVARQLRARPGGASLRIVALTGWGQEEDRRRAREAGFDHHLVKPADIGALQALLATLQ